MKRGLALILLLGLPAPACPEEIWRQVGKLGISVNTAFAHQGGLLLVHLRSSRFLGTTYAIFEGRRAPFFSAPRGPRALVPVPVTTAPGTATLGIELLTRRGRQRIALEVPIGRRDYPPGTVVIPEEKRPLLVAPESARDGRRLLGLIRAESAAAQWLGAFQPPVAVEPAPTFGSTLTYVGASPVERMTDALYGDYHRGLDYAVPAGTVVQAPAAGTVIFAGPLRITGQTLVLDHGQGVVSVLFHLSRLEVGAGDRIEGRAPIGLSGDTGLAAFPHVHWGVYVHGVPVDPRALASLAD